MGFDPHPGRMAAQLDGLLAPKTQLLKVTGYREEEALQQLQGAGNTIHPILLGVTRWAGLLHYPHP
eukprot:1150410-Pelagomonas_calceolata.AAC.5